MKRILLILCLLLSGLPFYAQQTGKVTAKFFPDPQVDIDTPAFAKKHGFTTYREMMTFLHDLATTLPVRLHSTGPALCLKQAGHIILYAPL